MAITLEGVSFDASRTTVREKLEEVGGRNERVISLSGVIEGENSAAGIESRLDAIVDAASVEDYSAELSLRAGRRLFVRRQKFSREISADLLVGSFTLELAAKQPFEEASSLSSENWPITVSGATKAVTAGGTMYSRPILTAVASGTLVNPCFSDGARTLAFSGTVADGETLLLEGETGVVTLEGVDVTPYTSGLFPRIDPAGTTLTYTDDGASSHTATVTVAFRDRWW